MRHVSATDAKQRLAALLAAAHDEELAGFGRPLAAAERDVEKRDPGRRPRPDRPHVGRRDGRRDGDDRSRLRAHEHPVFAEQRRLDVRVEPDNDDGEVADRGAGVGRIRRGGAEPGGGLARILA